MAKPEAAPVKDLNWDAAASDYSRYRPGYPPSFFELLRGFGIGHPGQRILDLGAGAGALALPFARQGASVVALDISKGQLEYLEAVARAEGLAVSILQGQAERTGLPASSFDAVTASMCWSYFDRREIVREVPRLLAKGGRLLVSSVVWTGEDPVGRATNVLLARLHPGSFTIQSTPAPRPTPEWLTPPFSVEGFRTWIEAIPFTPESWRGRIRASKWVGAALEPDQVEAFDREHEEVLRGFDPEAFRIPHRITVHVFNPEGSQEPQPNRSWIKRLLR